MYKRQLDGFVQYGDGNRCFFIIGTEHIIGRYAADGFLAQFSFVCLVGAYGIAYPCPEMCIRDRPGMGPQHTGLGQLPPL